MAEKHPDSPMSNGNDARPMPLFNAGGRGWEVAGSILGGLRDGILFIDTADRVVWMNPVMERILGVACGEARGRSLKEVTGEHEIYLFIDQYMVDNPGTFNVAGHDYEVEASEIKNDKGGPLGLVALFHDITEKRRLERQRAEFLSMVSHDLKAPLTAILGYSELILSGSLGDISRDVRESVETMDRSGRKILALIGDFLTVSKLDAGLMAPNMGPVWMDRLAVDVVSGFYPAAAGTSKRIELMVDDGLPLLYGDKAQIERVLTNLIDNALKFTCPGGCITVSVSQTACEEVAYRLGREPACHAPHIEVKVEDDGMGIAPDDLPHIFDRYRRGRTSAGISGAGLGLAIVKSVTDAHSGEVVVESAEGKGACFRVWLPVSRPHDIYGK